MSEMPWVSICIPVYNAERYVAAALDSALGQTYPNVEIIAVNDGSTDGSGEVLAQYEDRIRVVDQDNRGQCAAANRAFAEATGELIKFFDADDVLTPEIIERQVKRLGARRNAVAMGEWTRFYGAMPAGEIFEPLPMYRDAEPADWLTAEWTDTQPMMQCALWLIPRTIIQSAGLWDERMSLINDFEYFARVLTATDEILYTPGARFYYRSGVSNSLSGQKSRRAIESQFLSLTRGTEHLLNAENSARTRRASANLLAQFNYEHYPYHPDLRRKAQERIAELGGANIAPIGPPNFHRLRRFIGWRAARRVQHALGR